MFARRRSQPSATVRNRSQTSATVRNLSREVAMAMPLVSIASFRVGVALRGIPTCVTTCRKSFCVTRAIFFAMI